jgi:hypothetical protein
LARKQQQQQQRPEDTVKCNVNMAELTIEIELDSERHREGHFFISIYERNAKNKLA